MDWEKTILPEVRTYEPAQYVYSGEGAVPEIDCSLGTNPLGANELIMHKWNSGFFLDPSLYPGDQSGVVDALVSFWDGVVKKEDIFFGTGSIGVIFSLARILISPGTKMLGIAPQFSDGAFYFTFSGARITNVELKAPEYLLNVEDLTKAMSDEISLVYLDRPHNPTGQVMSLEDVDYLAAECEGRGALLLVDEAYGGFIPEEDSALNLLRKNIVCIRSFSKAWGLAGLRVGYTVIRDERLQKYYRKVSPPFSIPVSAMELIPLILKDRDYLRYLRTTISELKEETINTVLSGSGFSVAPTCSTVPIMIVTHENTDLDLYDFLLNKGGIKTEPGWGFENLGNNSVRLRVPGPENMEAFKKCWAKVCRELEKRS